MKITNAVLDFGNDGKGNYSSIPSTESQSITDNFLNPPNKNTNWTMGSLLKSKMFVLGVIFTFLLTVIIFVLSPPSHQPLPEIYQSSAGQGYCKTSCNNACGSYESVYGKLCCDWASGEDGSMTCPIALSGAGVCFCGSSAAPTSPSLPVAPSNENPVPSVSPAEKPSKPSSKKHDDDNHGFEPIPWMPWVPIKPIKVPDDATPCKKECSHPCGWSQSNGVSMCCEATDNSCGMTQVNGKCYCG